MAVPRFMRPAVGISLEECTPAPSADLLTEELHGRTASEDSGALEDFMVEASTAEAGDKGENDEYTSKIE